MKTIAYLTLTGLALVQGAQIRVKADAMKYTCVNGAGPSDAQETDGWTFATILQQAPRPVGVVGQLVLTHAYGVPGYASGKCEQFCDNTLTCIAFDLDVSQNCCRLYATDVNVRTGSSAPPGRTWCSKIPPKCTDIVTLNPAITRRLQRHEHKIGKGKYNKKALKEMGLKKNDVSLLKVPDNCQVIFYKGGNFNGKAVKFEGPGAYDCRGKDVSSLKVTNSAAYQKAQGTRQKATKAAKLAALASSRRRGSFGSRLRCRRRSSCTVPRL